MVQPNFGTGVVTRVDYAGEPFLESGLAATWHEQLSTWLAERVRATVDDATTTGKVHADPASEPATA